MKAIVMNQGGETPQYKEDFPEPIVGAENEILISVKASAIKNLDKSKASGKHYSTNSDANKTKVPGMDGVGLLQNGTRVYAIGITGMMAEMAIIEKSRMVILPDGIDNITAAALPNAVAGSAMALRFRAKIKKGETVLINGSTGFTGIIALQIARHYGAEKIIVTGRNEQTLLTLLALGADEIVPIKQDDADFVSQIRALHKITPIDIIIDYLWGHSAELILEALKGKGSYSYRTRFVSIGSISGDKIQLSSEILRSIDLLLTGSGLGSWTKEEMKELLNTIIPEMFQLAASGRLNVPTETIALKEVQKIWNMEVCGGKRLVVTI